MAASEYSATVKLGVVHNGRDIALAQLGDTLAITRDDNHGLQIGDWCCLQIQVGNQTTAESVTVVQVDGRRVRLEKY